jgi:predicted RNA methylase
MSFGYRVRVSGLPSWLDWKRLLGPGDFQTSVLSDGRLQAKAELSREAAADLGARLRGVGIGGAKLEVEVQPALERRDVRRARAIEARRYRDGSSGFSLPGVQLDQEARHSLTPEALAIDLGRQAHGVHVLDAGCGAGGNAIGFARAGCTVTAIELDRSRLDQAKHNARLYGVAERIHFIGGDASVLVPEHKADLLFIDPPWGGAYDKARVTLADLKLLDSLLAWKHHFAQTWAKVPPSFDPTSAPTCSAEAWFGTAAGDEARVKFLLLRFS